MGLVEQAKLSWRMTVAAGRMTLAFPASLSIALANLVFLTFVAVFPIATMIYLAEHDPASAWWALRYVFQFWFVSDAYQSGGVGSAAPAFLLWLTLIYSVWMSIVAFGTLVATTIIMHTGVMQIRGLKPSLGAGWRVARPNLLRLAGLAVIAGAVLGLTKRFTSVLRVIPFAGRFMRKAIVAALTGALYVALPVVVYERRGVWASFRSTFDQIRKTWGGLVVGTGLILSAMWLTLWVIEYAVARVFEQLTGVSVVNWGMMLMLQLVGAVVLYCVNVALSANLRAALYLHVTEGKATFIPAEAFVTPPVRPVAPPVAFTVMRRQNG